jgi:phage terminase large subunit GpA-like protein
MLNTTTLKDMVAADMERTEPGPGYMHYPTWLKSFFYQELTAEVRTFKGWENPADKRNEAFDLYTYGRAACKHLKAETINWESPPSWAKCWDENPDIINPKEEKKQPSVNRNARNARFRFS